MSFDILYEIRLEGIVNKISTNPHFPTNAICDTLPKEGVTMYLPLKGLKSGKAKVKKVHEKGARFRDVESGKYIRIPAVYVKPID